MPQDHARPRHRLLLIDEDAAIQDLIRELLAPECDILLATTGRQLLQQAREQIDLIILDWQIAGLSGLEICQQLGSFPALDRTPIIVLTDPGQDRQMEEAAFQAGAVDFVHKPINPPAFRARVLKHLESSHQKRRLARLAVTDALTGLPNRALFQDRLQQARHAALRTRSRFALIFLDLDRFKAVNDTYGHDVGDELLCLLARRLSASLRDSDTICRQGGDEFLILLNHIHSETNVRQIAQKILEDAAEPYRIQGQQISITVSLGIALFPDDGDDESLLLRQADRALYQSKNRGRNNYSFLSQPCFGNSNHPAPPLQEHHIRTALRRKQFQVHFQPIISLTQPESLRFEALARWTDDQGRAHPATDFIPIAEACGLIDILGLQMLEQTCRHLSMVSHDNLRVSVNVSALQIEDEQFVLKVHRLLNRYRIPQTQLTFELTESALLQGTRRNRSVIKALKQMGIRIAIDDFGTGYASLNNLRDFQVDQIKIDRSFVAEIEHSAFDRTLVHSIIRMAESLGLDIVAEGIEHEAQARLLQEMGCSLMQGYLYGPAQDPEILLGPYLRSQ